jgi:hypothetical protein
MIVVGEALDARSYIATQKSLGGNAGGVPLNCFGNHPG